MFVTQGPIDPGSSLFTGRGAELKRMETWLANANCVGAVLGARQTGKTSLLLNSDTACARSMPSCSSIWRPWRRRTSPSA